MTWLRPAPPHAWCWGRRNPVSRRPKAGHGGGDHAVSFTSQGTLRRVMYAFSPSSSTTQASFRDRRHLRSRESGQTDRWIAGFTEPYARLPAAAEPMTRAKRTPHRMDSRRSRVGLLRGIRFSKAGRCCDFSGKSQSGRQPRGTQIPVFQRFARVAAICPQLRSCRRALPRVQVSRGRWES
jgi:hypothetical protein